MPIAVSGDAKNEQHRDLIRREQEKHYHQKGISWKYEKEARLILSPPPSWLFGENLEYSTQERLFHYEPSHLVGIIYGAKLSENDRKRIRQIIDDKKNWDLYYVDRMRIEFNFVEFEAKLSKNQREIEIEPLAINTYQRIYKTHKDFDGLYKAWKEGWGSEGDNKSRKIIKVD